MPLIPHPTIPILEIRVVDIWALLLAGVALEALSRGICFMAKRKSSKEAKSGEKLLLLQFETAQKRRLGPSAFVETSKLERQVLAKEKEVQVLAEKRKKTTEQVARIVSNLSMVLYVVVFCLYYSLPVLSIDGTRVGYEADDILSRDQDKERATAFVQGFLFPLSYIGMGVRISRFGLPQPGIGALAILWSSQVTVGKLVNGFEALMGVA